MLIGWCAAAMNPGLAQVVLEAGAPGATTVQVELGTLPPPLTRAALAQTNHAIADWRARPASGMSARWWISTGALAWGIGTDLPADPSTFGPRAVLAVRAELGANARIGYDLISAHRGAAADEEAASGGRLALEFRTTSATRDLREGLLKVQLSNSSSLHFRPRRSGVMVSWRAQF